MLISLSEEPGLGVATCLLFSAASSRPCPSSAADRLRSLAARLSIPSILRSHGGPDPRSSNEKLLMFSRERNEGDTSLEEAMFESQFSVHDFFLLVAGSSLELPGAGVGQVDNDSEDNVGQGDTNDFSVESIFCQV